MSDVMCDFCAREWSDTLPMVEGHQGSCICGECLAAAYRALVLADDSTGPAPQAVECTLCLERREGPTWTAAPAGGAAASACRRCVKQSAAVLQKDPDLGWRKPQA
ncbi:MAG: hypothetical protein RI990_1236 [Planctomycetota bacterium]